MRIITISINWPFVLNEITTDNSRSDLEDGGCYGDPYKTDLHSNNNNTDKNGKDLYYVGVCYLKIADE
ncbi:unnamed protein product [Schistosoma mattheei]|uniref:Uncharacterized protein n=1 Tax=Schistosoma mattheei TaxID=31246 RepID=A0AA85B5S8_9TREM|nr:unnamed protein product [Schistosoma mattheei]